MLLLTEEMLRACRLDGREAVVCAFSGGPDSTDLLLELKRFRDEKRIGPLYAAHFEHGIRGREAREDLSFCRALCLSLGIPLFSESGDVPSFAQREGLSLETAARKLRYAFLRRLKDALGAKVIALGHNRDDHLRNFSFLMDAQGKWTLAPFYDFTWAEGPNGWQTLSVAGEGRNPGIADLERLAARVGLEGKVAKAIIDRCSASVALQHPAPTPKLQDSP